MTATTEEEVFDFEGNLESAFAAYLTSKGLPAFSASELLTLPPDYVSVEIGIGGLADEHMSQRPEYSNKEYDHYNYTLTITVHTDRDQNTEPSSGFARHHNQLVAQVRNALSISKSYDDGGVNEYIEFYTINRLMPETTERQSDDRQFDLSILSFAGDFTILTKSWPIA